MRINYIPIEPDANVTHYKKKQKSSKLVSEILTSVFENTPVTLTNT